VAHHHALVCQPSSVLHHNVDPNVPLTPNALAILLASMPSAVTLVLDHVVLQQDAKFKATYLFALVQKSIQGIRSLVVTLNRLHLHQSHLILVVHLLADPTLNAEMVSVPVFQNTKVIHTLVADPNAFKTTNVPGTRLV